MLKYILIIALVSNSLRSVAQDGATDIRQVQIEIDARQRVIMKDSLKISDVAITKVFAIRDEYFKKVKEFWLDKTLTEVERSNQLRNLRGETGKSIRTALGTTVYERYIEMIRRRIQKAYRAGKTTPLTEVNED